MSQGWFYALNGQQQGPVEWAELQKLAAGQKITANHHIWTEGYTDWVPAASVKDLINPSLASSPASSAAPQVATATRVPGAPGMPVIDYSGFGGTQLQYAGFLIRFLASFIDGIIILIIGFGLTTLFVAWIGSEAARDNSKTVVNFARIVFITVAWIYCCMLESGSGQSTLGKRLLGLRVTDLAGNQISFGRATGRHFGKVISQAILMIGYLMMKFTPNNQCLHDIMAGCVVVKKEWT